MKYLRSFNENKTDDILDKVVEFANNAHEFHYKGGGPQLRKYSNEPYIKHPITVCNICEHYTNDICILVAALLHDVIEDTNINKEQINEFLSQYLDKDQVFKIIKLVNDLTDVYTKEDYSHLNRKQRKELEIKRMSLISPDAQTIKYADMLDNAPSISANDEKFKPVYISECKEKIEIMDKGNSILRRKVIDMLNNI